MPTTATHGPEDARIRECLVAWAEALHAKNIGALMSHYAPDTVTFDLRPPSRLPNADAYRKNFEAWFASVQGPIDFEMRDLRITTSGDAAFCHYLGHVESTRMTGEKTDYWVRVTSGLRQMSGRWRITHEHVSMPIDVETMQASFSLQP